MSDRERNEKTLKVLERASGDYFKAYGAVWTDMQRIQSDLMVEYQIASARAMRAESLEDYRQLEEAYRARAEEAWQQFHADKRFTKAFDDYLGALRGILGDMGGARDPALLGMIGQNMRLIANYAQYAQGITSTRSDGESQ